MLLTGTMTPECCTHWAWGCVVSLTGGKGENILTSLDAGGAARVQLERHVPEEQARALIGLWLFAWKYAQVGEWVLLTSRGEAE